MSTNIPPEWDLGDWEKVLTINVGTAYACRECHNLVMITRGGIGLMQLTCCGKPMVKMTLAQADKEDQR